MGPFPLTIVGHRGWPALGVYAPFNLGLYSYAGNNPTNLADHNGQYVESVWDGNSLGLGIASLVDNMA